MSLRGAGRPGVVRAKESSRGPSRLRPPPRAPAARGKLRTARGPGSGSCSAHPPRSRGRHHRCTYPRDRDRAPDRGPQSGTECPAVGREVSSGPLAAAAWSPLPARRARAGTQDSDGRGGACAAGTVARSGSHVPQPELPSPRRLSGRWVWPPLGADAGDRTRRSPSFLSLAGAIEPAGGREEAAPGPLPLCAPWESLWPPRSDVDPPAPDLNRRRSPVCRPRRSAPCTGRAECDPPPPAALSLRAEGLPAPAGPPCPRPWPRAPGRRWERDAAAPRARELAAAG